MIFSTVRRAADEQKRQRFVAIIFQRMLLPKRNEYGIASFNLPRFIAHSHQSTAAQNVVNLFRLVVIMSSNFRAHW